MPRISTTRLRDVTLIIWIVIALLFAQQMVTIWGNEDISSIEDSLSEVPGGFLWNFLQDTKYSRLEIEIDGLKESVPVNSNVFSGLNDTIGRFCNKEYYRFIWDYEGSEFVSDEYSVSDVKNIAERTRDQYNRGYVCTLHILFLNGKMTDLHCDGVTINADTIVIFPNGLSVAEIRNVLVHEFGHILGLCDKALIKSGYFPINVPTTFDKSNQYHCEDFLCYMHSPVGGYANWCGDCVSIIDQLKISKCPYYGDVNLPSVITWEGFLILNLIPINLVISIYWLRSRNDG